MAQKRGKLPPEDAEPSRSRFEKLYSLMAEIRKLEPWNELWDMDLVFIYLPGTEEPVACSVMGRNGECYGIGVYPGYSSIGSFFRIVGSGGDNPFSALGCMDCINCYFGGKDELDPPERKRIKDMGLVFRGKNNWPYFRRSRPERLPWSISEADAEILETVLEQFIAAYKQYIEDDGFTVDFEENEVLCRRYEPEARNWTTLSMAMPPIPIDRRRYIINNEVLIASLKAKDTNGVQLEVDTLYFPLPSEKGSGEAPYLFRFALLVDADKEIVVGQRVIDAGVRSADAMIDVLAGYIKEYGRPETLFVRDEWAGCLYGDFCEKTGISMDTENGVPLLDEIAEGMAEQFTLMERAP